MISKLLVANRGEIASRVMRTAREMDIATVAVYSDADRDAPFVGDADESVHLPGNAPAETYLNSEGLLGAARRTRADAVHPGYGFLSENAEFARACAEAGVVFVGPSPEAIDAMGSKVTAKELMAAAGVPVLPGITVNSGSELDSDDLAVRAEREIGYPVLVKAAYGGGGRGMRVVHDAREIGDAVSGARREAKAAFGNGTVFLEHYVESPRHVEVQIFGDSHGTVVHLFERECSVQRRYQKVLEESPSPSVDDTLRAQLCQAAVAAGKAIGYVGAGTVEFVLGADGRFHFLEVNTRLQVEHPVTELVTGLDLVRVQLLVADGEPLPANVLGAALHGHAIEARLYAEDVSAGFLPAIGTIHRFIVPEMPGLRVDAGVAEGSEVGVYYDPMLAKVIAWAPGRDEACRLLARALAETRVHGVTTNRELLIGILREPEFRSGRIDTGYLTRHEPEALARAATSPGATRVHALAAALADQARRRADAPVLRSLPTGWRNVASGPQQVGYEIAGEGVEVRYRFGRSGLEATVSGRPAGAVQLYSATPERVDIQVEGVRRQIDVHRVGKLSYVDSALGSSVLVDAARFPEPGTDVAPGSLLAPMPGTIVRVAAEEGQRIAAGAPVVVLEAMKMEHTVLAPRDGTVGTLTVSVGQQVDTGTVLAVVE
ncbi:MAG: biotin carboxylase N-terminal domain-containing protein [Acidimicrobiales bacterium]